MGTWAAAAIVGQAHAAAPAPAAARAATAPAPAATQAAAEASAQAEAVPEAPPDPEQIYLGTLRASCERRWTKNFIAMAEQQLPATHPINDPARKVTLDVTLSPVGAIKAVAVAVSSGLTDFDASAIDVVKDGGLVARAPEAALSDDGNAHVVWTFERAAGRCAEVSVVQKESPLEQAVPRLMEQGREATAMARVTAAAASSAEPGITLFARAWLRTAARDKALVPATNLALAQAGDGPAIERLKADKSPLTEQSAGVLAAAGADVCARVSPGLDGSPAARETALNLLTTGLGNGCLDKVIALAGDKTVGVRTRAAALRALGATAEASARKAVIEALEDPSAEVRAAAVAATGRPGSGRPALFKLTPFLRDAAVEVRAAAGAAIVRAVGDGALDQLYLIWKETDPRPFTQLTPELATLSSQASVDLLAKMLKRDALPVRAAAAEALASRRDGAARTALAAAGRDASPDVRVFALGSMRGADRASALEKASPTARGSAIRALLRGGDKDAAGAALLSQLRTASGPAKAALFGVWLAAGHAAGQSKMTARR